MLDYNEIEILVEALNSWIEKDKGSKIFSTMMEDMLIKNVSPAAREKAKQEIKKYHDDMQREERERHRKATMLKAKLFQLQEKIMDKKSKLTIEDFIEDKVTG